MGFLPRQATSIHVRDLPYKHYTMLYRTSDREQARVRSRSARAFQRRYGFLADLLNEEDGETASYAHSVEQFFTRLEEYKRHGATRRQALLITRLQSPPAFFSLLNQMMKARLIRVVICRFGQERISGGEFEAGWDSRTGREEQEC